jgi:hypothetical protein
MNRHRVTSVLATIHPELQRPGRVGAGNAHWLDIAN